MNTTTRLGDWMQTRSGCQFYPLDPRPEDICIQDIAHALSQLCRFGGHCVEFYSVAQHCVMVASILPPELRLAGLLHDATEAYLVDIPRPLKIALPDYQRIEDALHTIIGEKFGVRFDDPRIKSADNIALVTEARDLLDPAPTDWRLVEIPLDVAISPMTPHFAQQAFLKTFTEYTK
jgi:hypothetical protein